MDRNSILGLILIVGILITFSILTKPSKEEQQRLLHQRDSIAHADSLEMQKQKSLDTTSITNKQGEISSHAVPDSIKEKSLEAKLGLFSSSLKDSNRYITVENKKLKIKFSTKGGKPYSVELKDFKRWDGTPVVLFDGDSTVFGLNFISQSQSIFTNDIVFKSSAQSDHITVTDHPDSISFRLYAGDDSYIEYLYVIQPNDYMIGMKVNFVNMKNAITLNYDEMPFYWDMYIPRQEKVFASENRYTNIQVMHYGDDEESMSASTSKADDQLDIKTKLKWIAFKQQFFSSVLIAKNSFNDADLHSYKMDEKGKFLKRYSANIGFEYQSADKYTIPMDIYFGPNNYRALKKYNMGLENMVFVGKNIVKFINKFVILPIFNWLNGFISNYGIIILILTLIIKLALFPLTYKSYQSQAKMRVLKPQIDEINKKIPKDKAMERQQATMALYKKAGVNPMGGCLPMLFQFPILIAMFRLFPTSIELRHQAFLWAKDLSTYDSILNLPFTIPLYGNHVSLFTLLMTASTIISMKMSQSTSADYSAMPGMKSMMYIMPVMFMFMLNSWSSGLTYYYFLANMITIGQNEIFKRMIDEKKLLTQIHANKAKPVKKSKWQDRLEKMAKQRGVQLPKK